MSGATDFQPVAPPDDLVAVKVHLRPPSPGGGKTHLPRQFPAARLLTYAMRIGIDISSASPVRTGIGTYTYELVRRLLRHPEHEFVLLFNSFRQPPPEFPELQNSNVTLKRHRFPGPALVNSWQTLGKPDIESLVGPVDFHSPATMLPPQHRGIRATTIHDLFFLRSDAGPQGALGGSLIRAMIDKHLGEQHLILVNSQSTAREVLALEGKGLPPDPVRGRRYAAGGGSADLHTPRCLFHPERFSCAPQPPGAIHPSRGNPPGEPRKNLDELLAAYRWLLASNPTIPPLVCAGSGNAPPPTRQQKKKFSIPVTFPMPTCRPCTTGPSYWFFRHATKALDFRSSKPWRQVFQLLPQQL